MHATTPPPTHHCVCVGAWAGKSYVRWESGEQEGRFPSQFMKNIRREKSNKMRGIAVPEEEQGSPIEIGNEPPSRKRDLGSVGDTAVQLLLDKVVIITK